MQSFRKTALQTKVARLAGMPSPAGKADRMGAVQRLGERGQKMGLLEFKTCVTEDVLSLFFFSSFVEV